MSNYKEKYSGNQSGRPKELPRNHPERWRLGTSVLLDDSSDEEKREREKYCNGSGDASTENMSVIEFYKSAINGVRRKRQRYCQTGSPPKKPKRSAWIPEEEVIDENDFSWIVDLPPKKRKGRRKDTWYERSCDAEEMFIYCRKNSEKTTETAEPRLKSTVTAPSKVMGESEPKKTEVTTVPPPSKAVVPSEIRQTAVTVPVPTVPTVRETAEDDKLYKFIVETVDQVLLIPVLQSEIKKLKVKWLADAIVERYYILNGRKHKVLVMTGEGYIVFDQDPLCILVNERVKTEFIDHGKYRMGFKFLSAMNDIPPQRQLSIHMIRDPMNRMVVEALGEAYDSKSFIIRDKALPLKHATVALEVLREENFGLEILDLSGNNLGDGIIQPLIKYLKNTPNVLKADLTRNGITQKGVEEFGWRLPPWRVDNVRTIVRTKLGLNDPETSAAWSAVVKRQLIELVKYLELIYKIKILET